MACKYRHLPLFGWVIIHDHSSLLVGNRRTKLMRGKKNSDERSTVMRERERERDSIEF